MTSVIITLALPPRILSPNARPGWRGRAKATRAYRRHAYFMTVRDAGLNRAWPAAIAQATFYWPDKQARDIRNAEAMLKPAYDGIVDARLIPDDRAELLAHERTVFGLDRRHPRVVIALRRVDAHVDTCVDTRVDTRVDATDLQACLPEKRREERIHTQEEEKLRSKKYAVRNKGWPNRTLGVAFMGRDDGDETRCANI